MYTAYTCIYTIHTPYKHHIYTEHTSKYPTYIPKYYTFKQPIKQVPYMRIPLVLNFFSKDRVNILFRKELRVVLRSILFEPRTWVAPQSRTKIEEIPTPKQNLATPYGLLMNEILFSPRATVEPLLKILENGVTLAVGNYASSFVEVFLFLIRLAVQVEGYIVYARDHWKELHAAQSNAMEGPPPTAERDLSAARGGLLAFFQGALIGCFRGVLKKVSHTVVGTHSGWCGLWSLCMYVGCVWAVYWLHVGCM